MIEKNFKFSIIQQQHKSENVALLVHTYLYVFFKFYPWKKCTMMNGVSECVCGIIHNQRLRFGWIRVDCRHVNENIESVKI